MDEATVRALCDLSRRFYDEAGGDFAATRQRGWRGWERWLERLPARRPLRVLDLGCGNARLLRFLLEAGVASDYLGIDASGAMLAQARATVRSLPAAASAHFERHELGHDMAELPNSAFDLIAAFGLMHHLPARHRRRALLLQACERLAAGGILAVSWWRFPRDQRFAERRIGWTSSEARADPAVRGVDRSQLEPGDTLVRFGDSDAPPRYCHFADDSEIEDVLAALPCTVTERYDDDGSGRRLNHYALLRRADAA